MLISLSDAISCRDAAKDAYLKALSAKSYGIGSRNVTRQSLQELKDSYFEWVSIVENLQNNGDASLSYSRRPILRDNL